MLPTVLFDFSAKNRGSEGYKPDSVPESARDTGGNHLSSRPEPGTCNAASSSLFPIWSCCGRGLPERHCFRVVPGGLLPHLFTLTGLPRRFLFCCTFLPAAYGPQHPSFITGFTRRLKRTSCSVQSGLSSPGIKTGSDCLSYAAIL